MALKPNSIIINGDQTIGAFLDGKAGLRVPPSQRSYRWKKEHVESLYDDIRENINNDEYFLGSVVVIHSSDDKQTFVFDGQQRIASTMILIAAIRDAFLFLKDTRVAEDIERDSLFSRDRETGERIPHFILNTEDSSFFDDRVVRRQDEADRKSITKKANGPANKKNTLPQSHLRIEVAAKLAADYVKKHIVAGLPEEEAKKRLHQWLNFIQLSLRAISIRVTDERTAFTIFETMNDRGLKVSAADLLKSRLYAMAGHRRDEVIQKWQSMVAVLEVIEGEEEGQLEYVRCFWVMRNGNTRTKELYDKMKEKVNTPADAVNLAAQLERSTPDYAAIILPSHPKWASWGAEVRSDIDHIKTLGVTQLRPMLLAAIEKFSVSEFKKLVSASVVWSVRLLLSGVPSGSVESNYARTAKKITEGTIKTAVEAQIEMAAIVPLDKVFLSAVKTAKVSNEKIARYYLHAMQQTEDTKMHGKKSEEYRTNYGDKITLEHILPEKPKTGEWDHFSTDDKAQYLHRLGNLALLTGTDNSTIENVEYEVKEPTLKASTYSLTNMTAGKMMWRKQEIEERHDHLAALAVATWPLLKVKK